MTVSLSFLLFLSSLSLLSHYFPPFSPRRTNQLTGALELLAHESRLVSGPPRVAGVDEGVPSHHAVVGEGGAVPRWPRRRVQAAAALWGAGEGGRRGY